MQILFRKVFQNSNWYIKIHNTVRPNNFVIIGCFFRLYISVKNVCYYLQRTLFQLFWLSGTTCIATCNTESFLWYVRGLTIAIGWPLYLTSLASKWHQHVGNKNLHSGYQIKTTNHTINYCVGYFWIGNTMTNKRQVTVLEVGSKILEWSRFWESKTQWLQTNRKKLFSHKWSKSFLFRS